MINYNTRVCSNPHCKQRNPQPISAFQKDKRCSYGYVWTCKKCRSERNKIYYENNKDKFKTYRRNLDVNRKAAHKYRARKKKLPATLTEQEWQDILKRYEYTCAYCPTKQSEIDYPLHQEHVIPVSRGGGYTRENIVPACKKCNYRKHDHTPDEAGMTIRTLTN